MASARKRPTPRLMDKETVMRRKSRFVPALPVCACQGRWDKVGGFLHTDNCTDAKRTKWRAALGGAGYVIAPAPDLRLDFYLVPYGYEVQLFAMASKRGRDGELTQVSGGCRDFDGSYKITFLREKLVEHLQKAIEAWRSEL